MRHTLARGVVNGIGNRCHWRHNGHLADSTHTIGVARIRHFHQDGVDHRQVERCRHAIIEEARIDHVAVVVVDKLFVQGPTDTLHNPTLDLAFDIARVDGPPHILHCSVAQNGDLTGIGINLDIHDMRGEGATHTTRLRCCPTGDGPPHTRHLCGDLLEGHRLTGILGALKDAIGTGHIVWGDTHRRTLRLPFELLLHLTVPAPGYTFFHL